jgi:hypothetical protein
MSALDLDDLGRALRTRSAPTLPSPDALLARAFPDPATAEPASAQPARIRHALVAATIAVLASSPLWLPSQPSSAAWSEGLARRSLDFSEQLIARFRN